LRFALHLEEIMIRILSLKTLLTASGFGLAALAFAGQASAVQTYACPNNSALTCHKPPCVVGDTASSETQADGTKKEVQCVMALKVAHTGTSVAVKLPGEKVLPATAVATKPH
jgi:hypothetical protein